MKNRVTISLLPLAAVFIAAAFFAGDALAQCGTEKDSACGQKDKACCGTCDKGAKTCSSEGGCDKAALCCPFSQCLVSGKKLADVKNPIVFNHEGRNIYFADAASFEKFKADKDAYVKKFDHAMKTVQASYYPLNRCVVSGDKFPEGKEPVDYLYKDRLVRFCCPSLIARFDENPTKYLAKLDAAVIAQQKEKYPIKTCIVSNSKLDSMGGAYDHIYGNQLVRFCCKGCVPAFNKNPGKYMAKLYQAWNTPKPTAPAAAAAPLKPKSPKKPLPKKTVPAPKPKAAKTGC